LLDSLLQERPGHDNRVNRTKIHGLRSREIERIHLSVKGLAL